MKYILQLTSVLCFICSMVCTLQAQKEVRASLTDVIASAQEGSSNFLLAKTRQENSRWRYISEKSNFKPQLSLNATLPSINRSISSIPLSDGTEAFVNRSFMKNSVGLTLSQSLSATGGAIYVSSNLNRLDQFKTDANVGSTSYLSSPVSIGFSQPILKFNEFKWQKERAKMEFDQSQKKFVEEKEQVAFDAMNKFFDLYTTSMSLEEAVSRAAYLDSLATNAEGRFRVGKIAETDLLQMQLGSKNASGNVAKLELEVQNKTEDLRDFLGFSEEVSFVLSEPDPLQEYIVDKDEALRYAKMHRSVTESFRLQLRQAEADLERAKKNNGPNLNLTGSFGLTKSGNTFSSAYNGFLDQEGVGLTVNVPIADFGRSKAQREIAKSNLELTRLQVQQSEVSFEREILVNVDQFKLKRNQLRLSEESVVIARKRLALAKKRYLVGKIEVTDLNIAIQEEQSARQKYFLSLWELWRAHYTLRNLTLYDFQNGVSLK